MSDLEGWSRRIEEDEQDEEDGSGRIKVLRTESVSVGEIKAD